MRPVCAIDVETDGLHWERQAWEVAFVRRDEHGTTEISVFLDLSMKLADPKALEIGGYYQRHPRGQWLTDATLEETDQNVGRLFTTDPGPMPDGETYLYPDHVARIAQRMTHGATIVGAQPHFDTHILERMMLANQLRPSWHYRLRDVESLTAGYFRHDHGGLAKCADALGLSFPEDEQHTALGDARMALAIYDAIIGTSQIGSRRPEDASPATAGPGRQG